MHLGTFPLKNPDPCQKDVAPFVTFNAYPPHVEKVAGDNGCGRVYLGRVMDNAADDFGAPHLAIRPEDTIYDSVPNFPKFIPGGENSLGTW